MEFESLPETSSNSEQRRATFFSNPIRDMNTGNVTAGVVSGLLALTSPPALILQAASQAHLTRGQTLSWIFAAYVISGLFSIVAPLWYRIPVTAALSLSGVAFVVTESAHVPFPELLGGYLLSGLIMFIVGISGVFSKLMEHLPVEVIAAMLSGLTGIYVVHTVQDVVVLPAAGLCAVLGYLAVFRWGKRIPPVVGALVFGTVALFMTTHLHLGAQTTGFAWPVFQTPRFTVRAVVTVALPLSLLVLSNDVAPGLGAMESFGFRPPIRTLVSLTGLLSAASGVFGGQSVNVAGMMSAICSDESAGVKGRRYVASVVSGSLLVLFGLLSGFIVPFMTVLPSAFLGIMAGFALIGVMGSSLQTAFSNSSHRLSAVFTFAVTLSNIRIFDVSSPVWALVGGLVIAKLLETHRQ